MSQLIRNCRYLVSNHERLLCPARLCKSISSNKVILDNTHHDQSFRFIAPLSTHSNSMLVRTNPKVYTNIEQKRFKKRRASKQDDEDQESDDEEEAEENPLLMDDFAEQTNDGSERMTVSISSLRLDTFCKTAFAMTRAKVEESFYKGDIFINGELPNKKSADISVNDEIDVVKSIDPENSKLVYVKRAIILRLPDKASEHGRMKVDIQRWQNISTERNTDRK